MEGEFLTLPSDKTEYGHELAYRIAREQLARIADIGQSCRKSGTKYIDSQNAILIEYLNQPYLITLPAGEVSLMSSKETVPIRDKILILHYFLTAKGTPLSHKLITFKELPEGASYFPTFYQRTIKPLVKQFGNEPRRLLNVAKILGGYEANYGDVAVTINAFSRVPVTLVLWKGDEEFPPEGNILFDHTISDYLPAEDITVLCEIITWRLIKLDRSSATPAQS